MPNVKAPVEVSDGKPWASRGAVTSQVLRELFVDSIRDHCTEWKDFATFIFHVV